MKRHIALTWFLYAAIAVGTAFGFGYPTQYFTSDVQLPYEDRDLNFVEDSSQGLIWTFNQDTNPVNLVGSGNVAIFSYAPIDRSWINSFTGTINSATNGQVTFNMTPAFLNTNSLAGDFDWRIEVVDTGSVTLAYAGGRLVLEENIFSTATTPLSVSNILNWGSYVGYLNTTNNGPYRSGGGTIYMTVNADGSATIHSTVTSTDTSNWGEVWSWYFNTASNSCLTNVSVSGGILTVSGTGRNRDIALTLAALTNAIVGIYATTGELGVVSNDWWTSVGRRVTAADTNRWYHSPTNFTFDNGISNSAYYVDPDTWHVRFNTNYAASSEPLSLHLNGDNSMTMSLNMGNNPLVSATQLTAGGTDAVLYNIYLSGEMPIYSDALALKLAALVNGVRIITASKDMSFLGNAISNGVLTEVTAKGTVNLSGATTLTLSTNTPSSGDVIRYNGGKWYKDVYPDTNAAVAFARNAANMTNWQTSFTPYIIPFAESNNIVLANGSWQAYCPTSTTTIYLPAATTNEGHSLRIDIEPGTNSVTIATNGFVVVTLATNPVFTIKTTATGCIFDKPYHSADWKGASLP